MKRLGKLLHVRLGARIVIGAPEIDPEAEHQERTQIVHEAADVGRDIGGEKRKGTIVENESAVERGRIDLKYEQQREHTDGPWPPYEVAGGGDGVGFSWR